MILDRSRRNVAILALAQALSMSCGSLVMIVSGLAGLGLAGDRLLATLPLSLQFLGTTIAMIPFSLLMRRIGRRAGFMLAAGLGAVGAAVAAGALMAGSFVGFCAGSMIMGILFTSIMFYRFAAVDVADEAFRGKAISIVLVGGVAASLIGPTVARLTFDLVPGTLYAGTFLGAIILALSSMAVLWHLDIPGLTAAERASSGRPLGEIVRQPTAAVAILSGTLAYVLMMLLMVATPLAMLAHNLDFDDTAIVIQWHSLGMYLPALVTGFLIAWLGRLSVMAAGAALFAAAAVAALMGVGMIHFWSALVLLGVGWNFLFVGSTTLLTETYTPAERAKIQGFNDFLVYGGVTVAAFSSGALHDFFGWQAVNYGLLPVVALALAAILWLKLRRRRAVIV